MKKPDPDYKFLQCLYRIGECDHYSEDPQKVLNFVIGEIVDYFRVPCASISLVNPNNNRLEIEASVGIPEDHEGEAWRLPMGIGLTGWVALHHRSVCVGDVSDDPRYVRIVDGVESAISVPMVNDSTSLGVVSIESFEKNAFEDEDLYRLEMVSEAVVRVLSRVWRIANLKRKTLQLESVVKMVEKVSNRFELDGILRDLTTEARKILNCEMCSLYLPKEKGTLELEFLVGPKGRIDYTELVNSEETSLGAAYRRQKTIEVSNLVMTEEHHLVDLADREKLVGMLSTPLVYEEKVIGLLNAYTSEPHRFSNTEKQVFRALADIGAFAIENAKLYNRIIDSENVVRNSERLTTLGLLSSELAHEIRNPLTTIRLLVESLSLDVPENDERQRDFSVILDKIDNLGEIVGRVLNFGKSQNQIFSRWSTHEIINDSIQLVRFKLKRSQISVDFEQSEEAIINCNKGQIQQVFLNLFINAEEAMPRGGNITIRSELSEAGKVVSFYFKDTGFGIPAGIKDKVFHSFLSGKPSGTGLGLSIVKRILKDHRGDVSILESSESGTTFKFWLPVHL